MTDFSTNDAESGLKHFHKAELVVTLSTRQFGEKTVELGYGGPFDHVRFAELEVRQLLGVVVGNLEPYSDETIPYPQLQLNVELRIIFVICLETLFIDL